MAETLKAQPRREREGFFEKYCHGQGLDIGAGDDPLITPFGTVRSWDKEDGDAVYLEGIADESFDFIYSSHCLEHVDLPHIALQNWFRAVKVGGYLIVCVPHRDLYEKKKLLPSIWNGEHRCFWMPHNDEPPNTFGLEDFIGRYLDDKRYLIPFLGVCDEGWQPRPVDEHSCGEYQIECVIEKI